MNAADRKAPKSNAPSSVSTITRIHTSCEFGDVLGKPGAISTRKDVRR
jgi:hypothetical protein